MGFMLFRYRGHSPILVFHSHLLSSWLQAKGRDVVALLTLSSWNAAFHLWRLYVEGWYMIFVAGNHA